MIDQAPDTWHDPAPGRRYGEQYATQAVDRLVSRSDDISWRRGFWTGVISVWLGNIIALALALS